MGENVIIKKLCNLELKASKQEETIVDLKGKVKEEIKKYDEIIAEIRSILKDERTGQQGISFPHKEEQNATEEKRLLDKKLHLPDKSDK